MFGIVIRLPFHNSFPIFLLVIQAKSLSFMPGTTQLCVTAAGRCYALYVVQNLCNMDITEES